MQGIDRAMARIGQIQARVANPPVPGRFQGLLEARLEADEPSPDGAAAADAPNAAEGPNAPAATVATMAVNAVDRPPQRFGATVTLGAMMGIGGTSTPPPAAPPAGIVARAELDAYLRSHGIESRNGRLRDQELVVVGGAWQGTARLLAPAATAYEAMRAAAAADGIELRSIDTYRSWESQNRGYQAYLRGEKSAKVLPPGESEHGNGLAIDFTKGRLIGPGDREWHWLQSSADRFGWYPISNESWHWEFRGI